MVKASSARKDAMEKERDAVNTSYGELRSSVKQRAGFANKEISCSEAKVVKVAQVPDASARKVMLVGLEA